MKTLDVQARLEYARAGVAVLRALRIADKTMRYGEFSTAIGLISDGEKWEPWHRHQIVDILCVIAATERQAGGNTGTEPIQFERIVNEEGQPGDGIARASRIVREPSNSATA